MAKTILALSMLIGTACGADDVALPQPAPQSTTTEPTPTTEASTTTVTEPPTTTTEPEPAPVEEEPVTVPTTRARSAPTTAPYVAPTTVYEAPARSGGSAPLACIRSIESGGDYGAVSADGLYRGAYQFDDQTWGSVGGSGDPADASAAEQDSRAQMLYDSRGLQPWPTPAGVC